MQLNRHDNYITFKPPFPLKWIWMGLLFLNLIVYDLTAQINLKTQDVVDLFEDHHHGVWINHFTGTNSEQDQIILSLGNDQKDYKGIIQNLSTRTITFIEGTYIPDTLKCIITDSTGTILGTLLGSFQDSFLTARILYNYKKQGSLIQLKQIPRIQSKLLDCPPQLNYFSSKMDSIKYRIFIQNNGDGIVMGRLENWIDTITYILRGNCVNESCNRSVVNVYNLNNIKLGQIQIDVKNSNIHLSKLTRVFDSLNLKIAKNYPFACKTNTFNSSLLSAQYLNLDDKAYIKWINDYIIQYNQKLALEQTGTDSTHLQKSFLTMDVAWISDYWISGDILITGSNNKTNKSSFNYSFRQNENLDIADLFEKEVDIKLLIDPLIHDQKTKLAASGTKGYKHFIMNDKFKHWTLWPQGICFSSEANNIWGTQHLLIPYKLIKNQIRKNGPLKRVL